MHEYLKEHPEKAFLLFSKVIIYTTNTKIPWSKLKQKDKDNKNFKWTSSKIFAVSKNKLTEKDIIKYLENSCEFDDPKDSTNYKSVDITKDWEYKYTEYNIYGFFPITGNDLKLLLNTLGIRMIHFIDN